MKIPLLAGAVRAGFPSPAEEHIEKYIDLNEHLIQNPPATFFVRVKGNSMTDAGIKDGDTLIIDRSLSAEEGRVVLASTEEGFTVKKVIKKVDGFHLESQSSQSPSVSIPLSDGIEIWGVVTYSIHKM
ncbi:MAG: translesion error-prone DNA polymerase V autoproteolytic subunit [Bacteroidota bacterium]